MSDLILPMPKGWFVAGSNPQGYFCGKDNNVSRNSKVSGYIGSKNNTATGFATVMQEFLAEKYVGKRLQLSVWIKSEAVKGWAGIWMRIEGVGKEELSFDNMFNRKITGTQEWKECRVVLDIPKEAKLIAFGVLLSGEGKIWFDDITFSTVDTKIPVTGHTQSYPESPQNLTFE